MLRSSQIIAKLNFIRGRPRRSQYPRNTIAHRDLNHLPPTGVRSRGDAHVDRHLNNSPCASEMKRTAFLHLVTFSSMLLAAKAGDRPVNGVYTGWKALPEMKGEVVTSVRHPDGRTTQGEWFRQHRIKISDDSLELFGAPVVIIDRELSWSASDGGFLAYRGKFYEKDGKLRIKFTPVFETEEGDVLETYGGQDLANEDVEFEPIDLVSFKLDGVVYTLQRGISEQEETHDSQK